MASNTYLEKLEVIRTFKAPIERVFDAWTNEQVLAQWFGPEGFHVSDSKINLAEGKKYYIELLSPEGNRIKHYGTYVKIVKPYQLVFTWILENQQCKGSEDQYSDTLVTIDFTEQGDHTSIKLVHEKLPNEQALDGHQFGWNSSLDSLEHYL